MSITATQQFDTAATPEDPGRNPLTGELLIRRDRWGRPYVVPEAGGRAIPYTRCTTFVGCVEDKYLLGLWQQRHVAKGIAAHDDLIAAVRDKDPDDKDGLNFLVGEAKERAGANDASRRGTYMHTVTEAADRGMDPGKVELPTLSTGPLDPSAYIADLAAYLEATEPFKMLAVEAFLVHDPLKVGGTTDRIVQYQGRRYIADLKTGDSVDFSALTISAQLAMYARSRPYDHVTAQRLDPHGCELDRGIVIHLPFGQARCDLYWVDLLAGWEAVMVARDVRAARQRKFPALFRQLTHVPPAPVTLADQIRTCVTADEVRALWRAHAAEWTDGLTALARQHISTLDTTPPF